MRFVFKIAVFILVAPFALLLVLLLAIAGVVGIPLLWERLMARLLAPPSIDPPAPPTE